MGVRFRTRLNLATSVLIAATICTLTLALLWVGARTLADHFQRTGLMLTRLANRNIDFGFQLPEKVMNHVEDQMVVTALVTAELVALAEQGHAASPEQVSDALRRVIQRSQQAKGYPLIDEFWVTDATGRAYINTEGVDFTFPPGSDSAAQASPFRALLEPGAPPVVQGLRERDLDGEPFLYVGVSGSDAPRIVQVGAGERLVNSIKEEFRVQNLVDRFMGETGFRRIAVLNGAGQVIAHAGAPIDSEATTAFCQEFLASGANEDFRIQRVGGNIGIVSRLSGRAGEHPGALYVEHTTRNQTAVLLTHVIVGAVLGLFMIAVGILVSTLLCRGLYRPIAALGVGAREFAGGNFAYRVENTSHDELGELADAFNDMAGSIQSYMSRLEDETIHRERLESELRIAAEVQRSLLPEDPPVFEDLEMISWSVPARVVGGDFYDFIPMGPGRLGVAVGDATGKGLPAALLITECSAIVRTLAGDAERPSQVLRRANNALTRKVGPTSRFVTLFLMVIDIHARTLTYSVAGHVPPLLVGPRRERHARLTCDVGFPLGIFHGAAYCDTVIPLQPEDTVLLYSDGVTEAHCPGGPLYGEGRLRDVLDANAGRPLLELLEAVYEDLSLHCSYGDASDDMTIVAVRYQPA